MSLNSNINVYTNVKLESKFALRLELEFAHHLQNRIFSIFRVKSSCFWCLVKYSVPNPSILIAGNTINARNTGNVSKMIKTNFELKVTENYLK